jgi:N-acetylmuramoyl-L-alanine amidase
LGRRIVIDAAHGGREPGEMAFDGTRACDLNLQVSRQLAGLLEQSGAGVLETRTGDRELSELTRVDITEPFAADVLVTVSFGAPVEETKPLTPVGHLRRDLTAFVGHYPGSVNGIRMADAIADELRVPVTACVSYMVQQSQSPAVHVQPLSIDSAAVPAAAELRAIAEAIHRGLIAYFKTAERAAK